MSDNLFTMGDDVEKQEERDSVGFKVYDSALMKFTIKAAYLNDYPGGSKGLFVEMEDEEGNKYTESDCVWSLKTKGPTYKDKKTGKLKELIGFSKLNSLGKLLVGKDLENSVFEKKVHEVYNKDAGEKIPTALPTLVEWTDKVVYAGMIRQTENKQTKSGDKYVDTNETRDVNFIDKWFNEDKRSLLEVVANSKLGEDEQKPATFFQDWINANEGKTRDKSKKTSAKSGAVGGKAQAGGATAAPLTFTE